MFGKYIQHSLTKISIISFATGSLAVGVPGELKGYWEAHKKYGRLPWAELVEPALKVCEEGYNMTKHQADSLTMNPNVPNDTTLRSASFIIAVSIILWINFTMIVALL